MGNGMRKYSSCDAYYKKRRKTNDSTGANFTKDYCEYWKTEKKGGNNSNDNFAMERNEFSFSNSTTYDSPLRNSRKQQSSFISSFDNSQNFSKNQSSKR